MKLLLILIASIALAQQTPIVIPKNPGVSSILVQTPAGKVAFARLIGLTVVDNGDGTVSLTVTGGTGGGTVGPAGPAGPQGPQGASGSGASTATTTALGSVIVPISGGLSVDGAGNLIITQAALLAKMGAATDSVSGYLTASDHAAFNNKQPALGFTPQNPSNSNINNAGLGNCPAGQYETGNIPGTTPQCAIIQAGQVNGLGSAAFQTISAFDPAGAATTAQANAIAAANNVNIVYASKIPGVVLDCNVTNSLKLGTAASSTFAAPASFPWKGNWAATTAYSAGDVTVSGNVRWIAVAAMTTSTDVTPGSDSTKWVASCDSAANNDALIQPILSAASASNPLLFIFDGGTSSNGLSIAPGGHTTIMCLTPDQGIWVRSGANNAALDNSFGSFPIGALPAKQGANITISGCTFNSHRNGPTNTPNSNFPFTNAGPNSIFAGNNQLDSRAWTGSGAAATAAIAGNAVSSLTLTSGGTLYTIPAVLFTPTNGDVITTPATATATTLNGTITGITLISGGVGYAHVPLITLVGQTYTSGITISNIVNLTIEKCLLYDAPSYSYTGNNITNGRYLNNRVIHPNPNINNDGFHVNGPSSHLNLSGNYYVTGDDGIALNAVEGSSGNISNVLISNENFASVNTMLRAYGGAGSVVSGVVLTNSVGSSYQAIMQLGYNEPPTGGPYLNDFHISNSRLCGNNATILVHTQINELSISDTDICGLYNGVPMIDMAAGNIINHLSLSHVRLQRDSSVYLLGNTYNYGHVENTSILRTLAGSTVNIFDVNNVSFISQLNQGSLPANGNAIPNSPYMLDMIAGGTVGKLNLCMVDPTNFNALTSSYTGIGAIGGCGVAALQFPVPDAKMANASEYIGATSPNVGNLLVKIGGNVNVLARGPEFLALLSPTPKSIFTTGSGAVSITISALNGFTGTITPTLVTTLPSGVTAAFSPTTITGGAGTITLTFTVSGAAIADTAYTVNLASTFTTIPLAGVLSVISSAPVQRWLMTESSGAFADSTGHANTLTATGVTYGTQAGVVGSVPITGTGSQISGANGTYTNLSGLQAYSTCMWHVYSSLGTGEQALVSNLNPTSNYTGWEMGTVASSLESLVISNTYTGNQLQATFSNTYVTGTQYFSCITYDGSKQLAGLLGYVNGAAVSRVSGTNGLTGSTNTAATVYIGMRKDGSTPLIGKPYDAQIWNYALSPTQIANYFTAGPRN